MRRHVDRHHEVLVARLTLPAVAVPARLFEHPSPYLEYGTRPFGEWNQNSRRDRAKSRVVPAEQRFDENDPIVGAPDHGLVFESQFTSFYGVSQVLLQCVGVLGEPLAPARR